MQAASDVAANFDAPVLLGDQPIQITDDRVKDTVVQTFKDLANPIGGGWGAIARDLRFGASAVGFEFGGAEDADSSEGNGNNGGNNDSNNNAAPPLSAADFFDAPLAWNMPVSLVRYPRAHGALPPVRREPFLGSRCSTAARHSARRLDQAILLDRRRRAAHRLCRSPLPPPLPR